MYGHVSETIRLDTLLNVTVTSAEINDIIIPCGMSHGLLIMNYGVKMKKNDIRTRYLKKMNRALDDSCRTSPDVYNLIIENRDKNNLEDIVQEFVQEHYDSIHDHLNKYIDEILDLTLSYQDKIITKHQKLLEEILEDVQVKAVNVLDV